MGLGSGTLFHVGLLNGGAGNLHGAAKLLFLASGFGDGAFILASSPSHGTLRRLARTGEPLTIGGSSLNGVTLLTSLPCSYSVARSYNATGSVVLLAKFEDGAQALLRVDIP